MNDPRRDHAYLLMRQYRIMRRIQGQIAAEIQAVIVARCGDRETYDAGCHVAVSREIDAIFNRYYGAFPGDSRATIYRATLDAARAAYQLQVKRSRAVISSHLSRFAPDVLQALREKAKEPKP